MFSVLAAALLHEALGKIFYHAPTGKDAAEGSAAVHNGNEVLVQRRLHRFAEVGVDGQGRAEVAPDYAAYAELLLRPGVRRARGQDMA